MSTVLENQRLGGAAPLDAAAVLRNVTELAPRFRERIAQTEQHRVVPSESMDELRASGMLRLLVPRRFGGLEASIRQFSEATAAVAYGCAATSWCAGQSTWAPLVISQCDLEVQEAVWGDGPDVPTASTAVGFSAVKVPGGYQLSGRGPFASGSRYAEWFYLGGGVPRDGAAPELRFFVIPRAQVTVLSDWDTVAMRGTGSNSVQVDGAFVPEEFSVLHSDLREATGPGSRVTTSPLYHLPWASVVQLIYTSTMIGATRAAYDEVTSLVRDKRGPGGVRAADSEPVQMQLGLVSAQIATAQLVLNEIAARADAGGEHSIAERALVSRDGVYAVTLIIAALDGMLELSGTSGFATPRFVQQAWRDVHFAAAHQALGRRTLLSRYGRRELGIEDSVLPVFY